MRTEEALLKNESTDSERYVLNDMTSFPGGACAFGSSTLSQVTPWISRYRTALLQGFSELRTLKDAADEILNDTGVPGFRDATKNGIMEQLNRLVDSGFLISETEILSICRRRVDTHRKSENTSISTVGILTKGRPDSLEISLRS